MEEMLFYRGVDIFEDPEGGYFIMARDDTGRDRKIWADNIPALKTKITRSIRYDNLKHLGDHVYVWF